jgi:hypothetical protein
VFKASIDSKVEYMPSSNPWILSDGPTVGVIWQDRRPGALSLDSASMEALAVCKDTPSLSFQSYSMI